MLDKYVNAVMKKVSGVIAGVQARRDELERQRGSDRHAQSYLGTALKHPEGHTSPLKNSAERAQQEYATIRAEWTRLGPQMLTLLVSLLIARERRDETKAVWERHDAEEQKRVATKYHPEVRRLFAQLYAHGVTPAMLSLLRPGTIAVLADLILWDAFDRSHDDVESPLQEIFRLYAERTMIMPGGSHDVTRSMPGAPPPSVKYTDPTYYQFPMAIGDEAEAREVSHSPDAPMEGQEAPDRGADSIPLASWSDLPRQFAGIKLVEVAPEDESAFDWCELPPFTDIAAFTSDGRRPDTHASRRETIVAWSAIIAGWSEEHRPKLMPMDRTIWAILLAHHLDNDASDISRLNGIELESPWTPGRAVRIVVLPPPDA